MTIDEKAFLAQVALGWFQVNQDGTIWRLAEFVGGGVTRLQWVEPRRAERSTSAEEGYLRILFFDQGERKHVAAHRIVWMVLNRADIPAPMEINHRDGKKWHNEPSNLELVTRPENVKHAIRILGRRHKAQGGEQNPSAKLTEAQVMEIRALCESKSINQREIAQRFGIKQSTVSAIVLRKKSWRHLA